jgi:hypothetical protein
MASKQFHITRLETQKTIDIQVQNQSDIVSFNTSIKQVDYKNSFTVINGKIKYKGLPSFDPPSFKKINRLVKSIKEGMQYSFIEALNGKTYVMKANLHKNVYTFNVGTIDQLPSIVEQYSKLNRNLNRAAFLLPRYIVSIENTKDATAFLKHFKPLTYFFCFQLKKKGYLFHQLNTKWNGQLYDTLYIGDIRVSEVANKMILEYNTTDQYLIDYVWTNGYKVSFANIINHEGEQYWLGTGIDLIDYVTPAIECKGDVQINGNFTLQDNNANVSFTVDNVQKNIVQLYKVGIGELYPESTLDIKDSSTQDVLTLIQDINKSDVYTNQLLTELKDASMDSATVKSIVERVCPTQTIDLFYVVLALEEPLDKNKITYLYFYPFPEWTDKNLPMLRADPTISQQLVDTFEATATTMASTYAGNGLMAPIVSRFVWGEKRNGVFYFTNKTKLYALATGKNVQNLNLKVNTNVNFSAYFSVENAYQYYLQSMLISIKNIPVLNHPMLKATMKDVHYQYPTPLIKWYDIEKETVAFVTYSDKLTLAHLNQLDQISIHTLPSNDRHKELSFFNNIKKQYTLQPDIYGMISYEDDRNYFMSQFYVLQTMVLAVELPIEDYLKPTLNVVGDSRLQGEVQVYDKNTSTQYTTIDPANHFVGIHTDKRTIHYSNDYTNTKKIGENLAQHHAYITNDSYPNLVCEVTNGTSAATMKIASNQPFSEMGTKDLYGPDISFEIEDVTEITREVGTLRMGYDSDNKIGFGVSIHQGSEGSYQEKQILSVDHTGCLSVNSIQLGNNSISVKDGYLQLPPSNKLVTRINQRETIETFYPFSMKNNTDLPMVNQYTIQLPDIPLYSLSISMEYTEYRFNVKEANSYYFKSHFTYDSTWTDKEIPNTPFTPTIYSCGSGVDSLSQFVIDYSNRAMTITINLPSYVYIVCSSTIKLGQLVPMDKLYDILITRTI